MSLYLLLLLLVCSAQASHFYGTVMTYYPKTTNATGSITVVLRYKESFHSCTDLSYWTFWTYWTCLSGICGTESIVFNDVDVESSGEWCQREGISTRQLPSNAPFELLFDGGNWIFNVQNITEWKAVTLVELRNRSDTGQANRSPQTTILPMLRVPSNCERDFNLLVFDPDGDEVKCRYGNSALSECSTCTPPSVLSLSSSCTLSFSPTTSSNEGSYVVQLVMEDFPSQTITLTQTNGSTEVKTTSDAISKIPFQFAVNVDAAVSSCTEGLYLPKFLAPTPANRARLYAPVNQTLEININAEANTSQISELLFSGPYNTSQVTGGGAGQYMLRWTPSQDEDGESHPICFVVQALFNSVKYHSELRCVIVSVGVAPPQNTTIIILQTPTSATNTTAPSTTTLQTTSMNTTASQNITTVPTNTTSTTTMQSTNSTQPTTASPPSTTTTGSTPPSTTTSTTTPEATTTPAQNQIVIGLRMKLSSLSPLSEDYIRNNIIQQIRDEMVRRGLPSDIALRLVSIM